MDLEQEVKQCKVELLPDEVLGWVIKPGPGCEGVFEEISKQQGPHDRRYLEVRKREQTQESTEAKEQQV